LADVDVLASSASDEREPKGTHVVRVVGCVCEPNHWTGLRPVSFRPGELRLHDNRLGPAPFLVPGILIVLEELGRGDAAVVASDLVVNVVYSIIAVVGVANRTEEQLDLVKPIPHNELGQKLEQCVVLVLRAVVGHGQFSGQPLGPLVPRAVGRVLELDSGQDEVQVGAQPVRPVPHLWRGLSPERTGLPSSDRASGRLSSAQKAPKLPNPEGISDSAQGQEEAYCKAEGRAAMFPNFVQMAETLTVPSLGPITPRQWEALPEFRRRSMSGYGSVELIGVPGCDLFVPFIRDRPTHQTELGSAWRRSLELACPSHALPLFL